MGSDVVCISTTNWCDELARQWLVPAWSVARLLIWNFTHRCFTVCVCLCPSCPVLTTQTYAAQGGH